MYSVNLRPCFGIKVNVNYINNKTLKKMKKIISTITVCIFATISTFAQYNVGTSTTTKTDMFSNTTSQQRSNTGNGISTW